MGHNYNLIARALLFGDDPDLVKPELSRTGTLIDDLNSWQSLGATGRLRNAIKWINRSPQRIHRFEDTQKSLWAEKFGWASTPPVRKLILANAT
jgi:hypothetical protein